MKLNGKSWLIIVFLLIATAIAVVCCKHAKLHAITPLTWDLEKTNTPISILMSDPNEPDMVQLREQYNLEDVVRNAEDDYAKLRLITGWVQKQWKHDGNNKPSRRDPLPHRYAVRIMDWESRLLTISNTTY
jgi:hypothetical protein